MYICVDCGHIFDEGEQAHCSESRGECWGAHCSEDMDGCPLCKGDYEEIEPCEVCGSYEYEGELYGGVCEHCISECENDFGACYEISKDEVQSVEINALLATLLTEQEINFILWNHINLLKPNISCKEFIDSDKYWFGEEFSKYAERKGIKW